MPVSPRTVERRIIYMATDATEQQIVAVKAVNVFSVALGKSIDINNNPRLAVVARYCSNGEVHAELCCLKSIYGTTKEKDLLDTFTKNFEERGIAIKKTFSVITNGTPAMMGQNRKFLVKQKIGHPVMKLHCIIDQENAKISNSASNDVMSTATKIVSFLVARCSTTHRQFQSLLEEIESAYHNVPLRCSIRWLNCGKVLLRFVEFLFEIRVFLIGQGKAYPELEDEKWLVKLMFLENITTHLNELIFACRVQGKQ